MNMMLVINNNIIVSAYVVNLLDSDALHIDNVFVICIVYDRMFNFCGLSIKVEIKITDKYYTY